MASGIVQRASLQCWAIRTLPDSETSVEDARRRRASPSIADAMRRIAPDDEHRQPYGGHRRNPIAPTNVAGLQMDDSIGGRSSATPRAFETLVGKTHAKSNLPRMSALGLQTPLTSITYLRTRKESPKAGRPPTSQILPDSASRSYSRPVICRQHGLTRKLDKN